MAFPVLAISVAACLIIVCAIAFTAYAQAPSSATSSQAPAEYRNDKFQFSLDYPADMTVSENNDAGGAQTISFLPSSGTGKQFQIEAIPYAQVDIAAGEYAPHDAYGTADQGLWLRDVNVVADNSTVQMWFVKTGVMYEVITFKGDEAWLAHILKTWQFN
jgi:hypothetical protein